MKTNPLWYKDAIIYEVSVKSFFDSNADGIGDFPGLIQKLDYIADLGVDCLWLLPFYQSPQKDDGYDISDYLAINPDYGTMEDFERELAGVEVNHSKEFIDEIPSAYKDIDKVMEYARPLVRVQHTLKQVLNIKGN